MNEYILCAAIFYNSDIKYPHQPNNIETGFVIPGYRHHNCFQILRWCQGTTYIELNRSNIIQGFLTNTNRFVDRFEAYKIAKDAGQLIHEPAPVEDDPILTSECIY